MDSASTFNPLKLSIFDLRSSRFSISEMSLPLEFSLSKNIFFGTGISFVSFFNLSYGFSANQEESVSGSRSLLIKELFAPFSRSLLTRYGSKSL